MFPFFVHLLLSSYSAKMFGATTCLYLFLLAPFSEHSTMLNDKASARRPPRRNTGTETTSYRLCVLFLLMILQKYVKKK